MRGSGSSKGREGDRERKKEVPTPSDLGPQNTVCLSWLQNHSALPHGSMFKGSLKDSHPLDPLILLPEMHSKKIIRIILQNMCKDVH